MRSPAGLTGFETNDFFERAADSVRAAPKEKNMKRNISLWLGLLAFALLPAFAQTPAGPTGKIHGHVTNPTGEPQGSGTVSLSTDGGATLKFTFPVGADGNYSGEASPGTYSAIYRAADTPAGKMVDMIRGVKIVEGQDVVQDIDMSRAEFVDKMPPEQKKAAGGPQEAECRSDQGQPGHQYLNADLKMVNQDIKDAEGARAQAATGSGRFRYPGRRGSQGGRDQDREVHRDRYPDDQGHRGDAGPVHSVDEPGARRCRPEEV